MHKLILTKDIEEFSEIIKVKLDFCMPAPSPPSSLSLELPPSHFRSDRGHRKKIIFVDVARNGVN
jgi:hypothetical protein